MLDTFREHSKGWLAKGILALIAVTFAVFGIDTYLQNAGSGAAVAKVDGKSVTMQEYSNAMQALRNQMQAAGKVDPALLENPEVRQSVLDKLVVSRLLNAEVRDRNFALSDESLSNFIIGLPEFQQNGKFSQELYDEVLKQNNMSPSQFEARMRAELLVQQARDGVAAAAFVPSSLFDKVMQVEHQQREISIATINADAFLDKVKVEPAQIKDYYEKNKEKFRVPEQVKIEYVMFSANNLIPGIQVSDEEAQKYYSENAAQFQGQEQRRASHILIGFGKGDAASKQGAREKANSILAEVKKDPSKFDALAKQYSQDPGSAQNGGDLGLFGRGMMVKPFEEAVFNMAPGAISDLVESEFGFHIIKLTEIQGSGQTFDEVKTNIRAELIYQKALAQFAEKAEGFSNVVYEQSDSLQPAAKEFGLQVQASQWMSRADAMKFFKSDKLVNAVFSNEVLKDKRNTEAVEVAPNTLLAARVIEYKPSAARSLTEISTALENFLRHEQAVVMAIKQGKELLSSLRQNKNAPGLEWIPDVVIDRKNAQGLSDAVMKQAFRTDVSSLPAFDGIENSGTGYTLIRIGRVDSAAPEDNDERNLLRGEMEGALAEEYTAAYLAALKAKSDITINKQLMEVSRQ
ncbi:MAG TPA: SurA N-terminal domain-containing protein [Methylophilaceae bacterium]|nr:SurA N-terminal domain-containing protein [Methylophilaceae bacterium]